MSAVANAVVFTMKWEAWRVQLVEERDAVLVTYNSPFEWVELPRAYALRAALAILAAPVNARWVPRVLGGGRLSGDDLCGLTRGLSGSVFLKDAPGPYLGPPGSYVHMTPENAESVALAILDLVG